MEVLLEDDKPVEKCGVWGMYGPPDTAFGELSYLALLTLQHRGQDAAGIGVQAEGHFVVSKSAGLVTEVFPDGGRTLTELSVGNIAIGHTLYTTVDAKDGSQPVANDIALSHNGHIEYIKEITDKYGVTEEGDSDSQGLTKAIDAAAEQLNEAGNKKGFVRGAKEVLSQIKDGAFSIVATDGRTLIAARDRHGFRPLEIGRLGDGYVFASESPAIDVVGATFYKSVEPGEMVIVDENGLRTEQFDHETNKKICAFEFIYFARPDSEIEGVNIHLARERLGRFLAADYPVPNADVVIGVPDSGLSAAKGYARQLGLREEPGLTKNRYVTRTFIKNKRLTREQAVLAKLHPNRPLIEDKILVVTDDSIVRGTTAQAVTKMLFHAGAREVHWRIPSPPYKWPCFYGMSTREIDDLLANKFGNEEMCEFIGATSLEFLSPQRCEQAIGLSLGSLCTACTTKQYPTRVPVELTAA